ncbi:RNA polymerase sigma factor SigY [Fictibacillus sp. KIGAM418]|uniref:RNA polymerase sigma factor SigY n=1 Tax=Fictibacillus marinisediminis TaxID=2878389 RepID=A0A9X2BCU0_9BACL|nr:RNA polymerase sigma factor SigY [Fictibacillus marinisediminis]MCK6256000.1 RNA polymerase sigma factor SigY [Fictibacillus marinisediminis]
MEEKDLVKKAKNGDQHSLSLLLQQNYSILFHYVLKITMNRSTAEDLVQETMLKCIQKIGLYEGKSKFSSWLISIASHLYIDQFRRKKTEQKYQEREQESRNLKWKAVFINEEWNEVLDTVSLLNEETRIPLILKHYYGYTYDEIGKMLNIPAGTVKSRVHTGLRFIRKELGESEGEFRLSK